MKLKIILIGLCAALGAMPKANAWNLTPRNASLAVAGTGFLGLLGTQVVKYFGKKAERDEFRRVEEGVRQSAVIKELESFLKKNDWKFLQDTWIKDGGRLKDLTYLYAPSKPEEKQAVEQDIRNGIAKKNKALIQKALAKIKAQNTMETFEYVLERGYWCYLQEAWIKEGLTELLSLHNIQAKQSIEQDIRNGIKKKDKEQIYRAIRKIKKHNRHQYHWDGHVDHDGKIREVSAWEKRLVAKAKSAAPKFLALTCLGLLGAAVLP